MTSSVLFQWTNWFLAIRVQLSWDEVFDPIFIFNATLFAKKKKQQRQNKNKKKGRRRRISKGKVR